MHECQQDVRATGVTREGQGPSEVVLGFCMVRGLIRQKRRERPSPKRIARCSQTVQGYEVCKSSQTPQTQDYNQRLKDERSDKNSPQNEWQTVFMTQEFG